MTSVETPDIFQHIQQLADETHVISNRVSNLAFAEDRGVLSNEEQQELKELSQLCKQKSEELEGLISAAETQHRREWFVFLQDRIAILSRLYQELQDNPRTVQGCSPSFLNALFPDLFRELRALQDGTPPQSTQAWTLACSREFADEAKRGRCL